MSKPNRFAGCQFQARQNCASSKQGVFSAPSLSLYCFKLIQAYLYDHLAGDKEVGGGERRPEEGSHHEMKNNAEIKIWNRFEFKSLNGIKSCFGNLCASNWISKCICMCVCMCMRVLNTNMFPRCRSRTHANVGTRRSALHSLETLASEARNRRAPLKHRKLMFLAVARTRRV